MTLGIHKVVCTAAKFTVVTMYCMYYSKTGICKTVDVWETLWVLFSLVPRPLTKKGGLVHTAWVLVRMCLFPQILGNPVIFVK